MSAPAREASNDYSTGSQARRGRIRGAAGGSSTGRRALTALAVVAIVLLVVSEFLPLFKVVVGTLDTETRTEAGWRNHGFAMLLLGVAAVPMLLGALRGARPAMWALAAIGAIVIVIALTVDLPAARESGTLRESVSYEDARAEPAAGFFVETLGGVMLLLAGGLLLLTVKPREPEPEETI